MKYLIISLIMMLALFSALFAQDSSVQSDAAMAQNLFEKMHKGDLSVIPQIDWDNAAFFYNRDYDKYAKLTDAKDKRKFQEDLIKSFAATCEDNGVYIDNLSDWGVESGLDSDMAVSVSCDPDWLYMEFYKVDGKLLLRYVYVYTEEDYYYDMYGY